MQAIFTNTTLEIEDVCLETCYLQGLNSSDYYLTFEVEDSELLIKDIKYELESSEGSTKDLFEEETINSVQETEPIITDKEKVIEEEIIVLVR